MRVLMWFTIGFALSCTIAVLTFAPWLWLLGVAVLLLCICAGVFGMRISFLRLFVPALLGFGIGCLWFCGYSLLVYPDDMDADMPIPLQVTISDYSQSTDYGAATDGRLYLDGKMHPVRIYHSDELSMEPGDQVCGSFLVSNCLKEGETYLLADGIHFLLRLQGEGDVTKSDNVSLLDLPAVWRHKLLSGMDTLFEENVASFCKALVLGDRSGLSYEISTDLRMSGIAHVVAVSGLHVSFLFGLIDFLTMRRRKLAALIGIPVLLLFAAAVGFTPSVTRACIMQILILLGALLGKDYDRPTALSFACLVMLAVMPTMLLSISFQMSVACIIGLMCFSQPIYNWILGDHVLDAQKGSKWIRFCKRWFAGSVSTSISACITTIPLVAYYFETISLVGILTNLLVLWVLTFLFYVVVLAVLGYWLVPVLGIALAWLAQFPAQYILSVCAFLGRLPLAAVFTQSPYIVIWLVGAYGMLVAFLMMKRKPLGVFIVCTTASLCVALGLSWAQPYQNNVSFTMLDVGQGQCLLLHSDGKTYMIDCGGMGDSTADLAADTLMSRGIYHLDGIILTHYDADHSDGLAAFLTRMDADVLLLPNLYDPKGTGFSLSRLTDGRVLVVGEDMELAFGQGTMRIFAPEDPFLGNECSLSVLFSRENCDILITGDRNIAGELRLMDRFELPQLELLVAGHHGADSSTGVALLDQTKPEHILVSCGDQEIYGHPSDALIHRAREFGCVLNTTDENGTIIYRR